MLISFTQTYGGDRKKLLEIYFRDKRLQEFKNHFDLNIYSFHNSPPSLIKWFKENNPVKNTKILVFNNNYYTDTIRELFKVLNQKGCTHFFFSQDDTFSVDNEDVDFNELLNYVKGHQDNFMLALGMNGVQINPVKEPFFIKKTFSVYDYTTWDYDDYAHFAMDDSPYICTFDILNTIYDEDYLNQKNIWEAELFLRRTFSRGEKKINRYPTDKIIFRNYNIMGKYVGKKDRYEFELKKRNLL